MQNIINSSKFLPFRTPRCGLLFTLAVCLYATSAISSTQEMSPGLIGTINDGAYEVVLVSPTPNLYLAEDESIHPQIAPDFTVTWSGFIDILLPGRYRFSNEGDSITCEVGGEIALGEGIALEAGRHPMRIVYERPSGTAQVRLLWEAEHFDLEPVPARRLYHDASSSELAGDRLVEEGRALVTSLGCVNCHAKDAANFLGRMGPNLTDAGARMEPSWIYTWLEDPQAFRSGAVMPAMLEEDERRDVTAYLASLNSQHFEPLDAEVGPHEASMGGQNYWDLGCAACHDQAGLDLNGIGSKMSAAALSAYLQEPTAFDPSGVMPNMSLSRQEGEYLSIYLTESRTAAFEEEVPQGDFARGKEIVARSGCLACHALHDPELRSNSLVAPSFASLNVNRGCLIENPQEGIPRYTLTDRERQSLAAFIARQQLHADRYPAPIHDFYRTLDELRCTACHVFEAQRPAVALTKAAPLLTGAGERFRPAWTQAVLAGEKRIRPWLEMRMPVFPSGRTADLPSGFYKAAGLAATSVGPVQSVSDEHVRLGIDLIGSDGDAGGLSCISCHDWGDHLSLGERGPQLKDVVERVRYSWFRRWLLQPSRIQSGTSMPTFFDHLDSQEAVRQINSLWAAFQLGEEMPLPAGLETTEAVAGSEEMPIPRGEAIVVRWYMPEATPAAIAVGMPGSVSYCFDAGECRMRYAWLGDFVDLTPTLAKPAPPMDILGDIFYRSDIFPIRIGTHDAIPETKFKGYSIIEGFPRFHYRVNGIDVFERIIPARVGNGFTREFMVSSIREDMRFVTETSSEVTITSTVGELSNGQLLLPRGTNVRFNVTVTQIEDEVFGN